MARWKRGKKLVSGRVADINGKGIFLEINEPIAAGQVMDLIVDLPSGPIEFLGVSRQIAQGRGIGISIFSMDAKDRARWDKLYAATLMASSR